MKRLCHNFDEWVKQYGRCPGSDAGAYISCYDTCPYMELIKEDKDEIPDSDNQ